MRKAVLVLAVVLTATPAFAQLGGLSGLGGKVGKAKDIADKAASLHLSEADERRVGEAVSLKVRQQFGVYQDKAVTKYVTLMGLLLAGASERPGLKWEFIVLDTDGVNAFAAPGGIVHITKGALGLIKSEAELAGVLGHEVEHVAQRHTAKSIEQNNRIKVGTDLAAGSKEWANAIADKVYDDIIQNGFDRKDEGEADEKGILLANKVGYNPSGIGTFLTKLMERNTGATERNGLFASHPETQDRIAKLNKEIKAEKLASTALGAARYAKEITFTAKPLAQITAVASGTKGVASGSSKPASGDKAAADDAKEPPKKKGGMSSLLSSGKQVDSPQASASAGGRAIAPDRDARGGPDPNRVLVTVTPAEVSAFKAGIA